MPATTSDTENNCIPEDDSEHNYYPGVYRIVESEIMQMSDDDGENKLETSADSGTCSNEPIADEEWPNTFRVRQMD